MAEEHLHDTIEKYLLGELSSAERERLEADIKGDPALFEQVEIQRLGLMGLQRLAAADLREKFDQWDEDLDVPLLLTASPPPPLPNRNIWVWTTAVLLLLLTAGAFWHFGQIKKERAIQEQERQEVALRDSLITVLQADYQRKANELTALLGMPSNSKDSIALLEIKRLREELDRKDQVLRNLESRRTAANLQIAMQLAPPSDIKTRGSGDSGDPTLDAVQKAYDAKDFSEAVRLLKSIPTNDSLRQTQVSAILPYALFYAQRFQEAIPEFRNLWAEDEVYEAMNAQGFLLLCYIAEGKTSEARQMRLTILKNPKHKYYPMANKLTDDLKIK